MKKTLSTLLTFVLIISIISCSKDEIIIKTDEITTITKIEFLNDSILNLKIGTNGTFKMRHEPAHLDMPKYLWHSSDINIVDINPYYGTYFANRVGECIVTATTNIYTGSITQELSAKCKIVVSEIEVENIEFDIKEMYIQVGEEFTLTTYFTPNNVANKSLEWSSSDSTIVNIDNKGNVYAKKEGECYVYAKSQNGKVAECKIVVEPVSIRSVEFNSDEIKLMPGDSEIVKFNIKPSHANITDIKWSIEDETVASITNDGIITCNSIGKTKLTLTLNKIIATECNVVGCEINELIEVKFGSSAIMSIMGYITGEIGFNIANNSKHAITIKNLEIIDGYTERTIYTTAFNKDILSGKSNISYSIRLNSIYKPIFKLNYIYNNKEYHTQKQFN